jgi:tetratricopeptide (TPR) repeat protein
MMSDQGHQADAATPDTSRPTLSVCMIVKDEERFLAQCLESIKGVADEIIIVDTGSTDSTVEIARRYTDRVYFHAWNNSFSEARNHSLSYATCDWILQIDADEELEREDVPLLLDTVRAVHAMPDVNTVGVPLLSTLPAGRLAKHYFPRLFRRGKAQFEGIVHNQLTYEGKHLVSEIRLWHYGYNLTRKDLKRKWKRTEELLLKQIAENPENTFAWMNLLRVYRNSGRHEEVIERGTWVLGRPSTPRLHRHGVACDTAISCRALERYAQGEAVLLAELERIPDSLDLVMELALIYFAQEDKTDQAINQFKRFLALKREETRNPKPTELVYDHYSSEAMAWNHLGGCYDRRGETKRAIDAFQRAIELCPQEGDPYANLALCYGRAGSFPQAESVLQRAIARGAATPIVWRRLGDVYRAQARLAQAEDAYGRARQAEAELESLEAGEAAGALSEAIIKSSPGAPPRDASPFRWKALAGGGAAPLPDAIQRARSHAARGAFQEAIEQLEQHLQLNPTDLDALADLATCYAQLQRYSAALEGYRCVLAVTPADAVVLYNVAALVQAVNAQAPSP